MHFNSDYLHPNWWNYLINTSAGGLGGIAGDNLRIKTLELIFFCKPSPWEPNNVNKLIICIVKNISFYVRDFLMRPSLQYCNVTDL